MVTIDALQAFDAGRFREIVGGYTTDRMYTVTRHESDERTDFALAMTMLESPQAFRFPHSDEELARYADLAANDFSRGAYWDGLLIGVALAEPQWWNRTLWVWEFHVAEDYRGQGHGRAMMASVADRARAAGLRAVVCETQNTNVPAIGFYRAVGFVLDGVDVSYYTNDDTLPGRTVAVFMKLKLE